MKKLSEITKEDAVKILSVYSGYKLALERGLWVFTDESKAIGEPTKKLYNKRNVFIFWFHDDEIDIDNVDDEIPVNFDSSMYDTKLKCYIKAWELGYYIKEIDELLRSNVKIKK